MKQPEINGQPGAGRVIQDGVEDGCKIKSSYIGDIIYCPALMNRYTPKNAYVFYSIC